MRALLFPSLRPDLIRYHQTFQRPTLLKDREISFRYSSRIRTLLRCCRSERVSRCSTLDDDAAFPLSNPPDPWSPLNRLHWNRSDKKYASLLRLLLTPSLVTLSLSSCMLPFLYASILTAIGTVCPLLKKLCITSHRPFADILDEARRSCPRYYCTCTRWNRWYILCRINPQLSTSPVSLWLSCHRSFRPISRWRKHDPS